MKKKDDKMWWKKVIDWFNNETRKWINRMNLNDWIITVKFSIKPFEDEYWETTSWWIALASTSPDAVYKKATIVYYPSILDEYNWHRHPSYTINCVKHEVCHLLTAKIWEIAKNRYSSENEINNEIETLTQTLSILIEENELLPTITTRASKMNKVLAKPKKQAKHSSPKLHSWPRKGPRKARKGVVWKRKVNNTKS
jgi:hypothetical protein